MGTSAERPTRGAALLLVGPHFCPVSANESGKWKKILKSNSRSLRLSEQPVSTASPAMIKTQVQEFWQASPCDSWFTKEARETPAFYRTLDEHRYKVHPRLQSAIGFEKTSGLRVLEIGCGCGSEAE